MNLAGRNFGRSNFLAHGLRSVADIKNFGKKVAHSPRADGRAPKEYRGDEITGGDLRRRRGGNEG